MSAAIVTPRLASRILLLDAENRLLLLRAQHPLGPLFWVAPGGGLERGETFEAAARRELDEETGQSLAIGVCVWTRRHTYEWAGRQYDQSERFFIARTNSPLVSPSKPDGYVIGRRWWTLAEIETSEEAFAPRRLAHFLQPILAGEMPDPPADCGV
jgi:8-oxo-dGTP pyrophosphatase MutT (NUDIX family)